jgi:hypothetical protein
MKLKTITTTITYNNNNKSYNNINNGYNNNNNDIQ